MAPIVVINTINLKRGDRDTFFKLFREIGGDSINKYIASCFDGDKNEAIIFVNADFENETSNEKTRLSQFENLVQRYQLQTGTWKSKKQMKILQHIEGMKKL